jgi:hypothetical protein
MANPDYSLAEKIAFDEHIGHKNFDTEFDIFGFKSPFAGERLKLNA